MTELAAPRERRLPNPTNMHSGEPADATSRTRILVVEDDFLISMEMENALTSAGFEVVLAVSGEEALRAASEEHYRLVVMDIRLSGPLDGVEAALELFQRYGLRSVFATAHSDPAVRARAAPARPLGWLTKPYSMAALVTAVRAALKPDDS